MQVMAIIIGIVIFTVLATIFVARAWLFPEPFRPTVLSQKEEQQLAVKLQHFENLGPKHALAETPPVEKTGEQTGGGMLKSEPYSEKGASREINLTEREINGLLANNTDLAKKLVLDLSNDLISAKLLLPVDPDFPILGGKTLKVRAGAELAYKEASPVIKLKGISIMGVPIPNAWLGGLKNIDLVNEFGTDVGFWKVFADGVEAIKVQEGSVRIKLKE